MFELYHNQQVLALLHIYSFMCGATLDSFK